MWVPAARRLILLFKPKEAIGFIVRYIFQYIARLAVECSAYRV